MTNKSDQATKSRKPPNAGKGRVKGVPNRTTALLKDALAIQERVLGKIHPQVAMGLNTLGLLEIRRGHFCSRDPPRPSGAIQKDTR